MGTITRAAWGLHAARRPSRLGQCGPHPLHNPAHTHSHHQSLQLITVIVLSMVCLHWSGQPALSAEKHQSLNSRVQSVGFNCLAAHINPDTHSSLRNPLRIQPQHKAGKLPWSLLQLQHMKQLYVMSRKLSLSFLNCFYCQNISFQQIVFSTGSKPDLSKEKL